jgi:hypothetical protein
MGGGITPERLVCWEVSLACSNHPNTRRATVAFPWPYALECSVNYSEAHCDRFALKLWPLHPNPRG